MIAIPAGVQQLTVLFVFFRVQHVVAAIFRKFQRIFRKFNTDYVFIVRFVLD